MATYDDNICMVAEMDIHDSKRFVWLLNDSKICTVSEMDLLFCPYGRVRVP